MVSAAPVPATVFTNRRRVMSVMVNPPEKHQNKRALGSYRLQKLGKEVTLAARMTYEGRSAARAFLASFLVLFLEVALIRWMPAYVRLLAYFSNFILLASFLGIGVGCLLAGSRRRLFVWFPVLHGIVVFAVYYFRLEIAVPTAGSIYFSSGTSEKVVLVESTMLLPLLFVIVAALFATMAQRMGREMAVLPALRG